MSEMEKLAAELARKGEERQQNKVNSEEIIAAWLEDLERLVDTVDQWLSPLKNTNVATTSRDEIEIRENPHPELATRYRAPVLTITLNEKTIKLQPAGRYMIGSEGVVELNGLARQVAFDRLTDGDQTQWRIRVLIPRQRPEILPFSSDSFAKLLRLI